MKETQSCYPGTWALRLILVTDPSSSGKQDWWMHVMALLLYLFHLTFEPSGASTRPSNRSVRPSDS